MKHKGLLLEQTLVSALAALPGLEYRVCPVLDIQQSTGPLVVFDQKTETQEQTLTGDTSLEAASYQIHVLQGSYQSMRLLAEQVRATLKALQGYVQGQLLIEAVHVELASPDLYEGKVKLFRRTYEITIHYQIKEE